MEIITEIEELTLSNTQRKYFTENTILFDIECTGLSPRTSFIYLIGYATRNENKITYTQLLANDYAEEREILIKFNEVISEYAGLMGFNSTRFDEQFILERNKKYGIISNIHSMPHTDIYLTATKAKCVLSLPNYKQKTMENFLGLYREDKYNGGELIPVYNEYSETREKPLKDLVLLHNLEDVKGMVVALNILTYVDMLNDDIIIESYSIDSNKLNVIAKIQNSLPSSISKNRDYGFYIIKESTLSCSFNLIRNTLYTFLADYKNYYYLLNEDIIIPKVIGQSIPKELKRNATKAECKVAKKGTYFQIPDGYKAKFSERVFKSDYASKIQYVDTDEITDSFLINIIKFMITH